jgi:hypothetical protein
LAGSFGCSDRLEEIDSTRRVARQGAGQQAQVADHRRIFDGGDDLQGTAAVRAVFDIDIEDPFEQPGPTMLGVSPWASV